MELRVLARSARRAGRHSHNDAPRPLSLTAPFLELRAATVVLGDTRVLDSLSVTLSLGEHTAILGPNGAGKSTFVRLLTLQQYPLADGRGSLHLFGRERWDVLELRSHMGIVSADLHDRFVRGNANGVVTGLDAVLSGFFATHGVFGYQKISADMRARAARALDRVGAGDLGGRTLDTLSTGEARRVLIARALAHEPKTLVLDEPTRGLDLVARHDFLERVREVAREGTTILLVTHYVEEIIPELVRVILLKGGRITADGRKAEILTETRLEEAFGVPVAVHEASGYYHVRVRTSQF